MRAAVVLASAYLFAAVASGTVVNEVRQRDSVSDLDNLLNSPTAPPPTASGTDAPGETKAPKNTGSSQTDSAPPPTSTAPPDSSTASNTHSTTDPAPPPSTSSHSSTSSSHTSSTSSTSSSSSSSSSTSDSSSSSSTSSTSQTSKPPSETTTSPLPAGGVTTKVRTQTAPPDSPSATGSSAPGATATPGLNDDGSSGASSGLSTGTRNTIIGVVVGVGGAILIAGIAFVGWRIWGRNRHDHDNDEDDLMSAGTALGANSREKAPSPGGTPFRSTLDQYHNPGPVNAASNF